MFWRFQTSVEESRFYFHHIDRNEVSVEISTRTWNGEWAGRGWNWKETACLRYACLHHVPWRMFIVGLRSGTSVVCAISPQNKTLLRDLGRCETLMNKPRGFANYLLIVCGFRHNGGLNLLICKLPYDCRSVVEPTGSWHLAKKVKYIRTC